MDAPDVLAYLSMFTKTFFHGKVEPFGCRLDDAGIGLMRNHEIDVFITETGSFQGFFRRPSHNFNGKFIDFLAVHLNVGQVFCPRFVRRQNSDAAGRDAQVFTAASVSTHVGTEDAIALRYGTEYSGPGSIAEKGRTCYGRSYRGNG